ncbi:PP2C family protein-serine/threonine phosphatase [uncultured Pseudokineococcus sp.]|uniref:PP2C family protein-serine/threonine phosphatase n=1 Tax=uncultured Pseudokineococcus sp. TaxID=1642928 RepID=UPI0026360599|nr:PP2C family protein-serine/threonine phosphatase [uncultured Pseudokineococcus sp.]
MPTESRTAPGRRAAAPTWVPSAAGEWLGERRRRLVWLLQLRLLPSQTFRLWVGTGLVVCWVVVALTAPRWAPASALSVVIVLGGYFLRLRQLAMLLFLVTTALVYVVPRRNGQVPRGVRADVVDAVQTSINPTVLGVLAAVAGVVVLIARSRERLGVHGAQGESMLVELRDRLRAQSRVSGLPAPWRLEHAVRSAYGDGFAGDFVLAHHRGRRLDVLLVDVSGKGTAAGTRALLLSGAYGGLVGALPTERLLPSANDYLLGQRWPEGFATAVHVSLDLATGEYAAASAGHPPLLRHRAGAPDRWVPVEVEGGPALGLLPDVDFPSVRGVLEPGDALILYTDGVVEAPGRDLAAGIDLLARAAGDLTSGPGLGGSARRLVDAVAAEDDDRSVVVLWRDPEPDPSHSPGRERDPS